MKTENWTSIQEVGFVGGMRFLFWLYRHVGRRLFSLALQPVALYYFLTNARARTASRQFLRMACGHKPTKRLVYRHFLSFARSIVDKLGVWSGADVFKGYSYDGREHLLAQLEKGEGAVLLGAHLGNMEVCRCLSRGTPGLKLKILVHTAHATMFNRLLGEVEDARDLELIEVSELTPATAVYLEECVQRGEFVAILADRVPAASRSREQTVDFFSAPASFPEGPFIIASLLKCPVYTLFCLHDGQRYDICCEPFAERIVLPRKSRKAALGAYVQQFASVLEEKCRAYPLQWFNFYPFWKDSEVVDK